MSIIQKDSVKTSFKINESLKVNKKKILVASTQILGKKGNSGSENKINVIKHDNLVNSENIDNLIEKKPIYNKENDLLKIDNI